MNPDPVSEPIPILHVINECDDDSITRIVERIIRYSDQARFRWHVCALRGLYEFSGVLTGLGARVVDGSKPGSAANFIKEIILKENIRIVHSHTPRAITATWQAISAWRERSQEGPVHAATKHLLVSPDDRAFGLVFTIHDRLTLYMPDHLVAVSARMARQIKTHPGINPAAVTTIPNSIPVGVFQRPDLREANRARMNLPTDAIVLGFTGRIEKVKRLDLLIEAFARLSPQYPRLRLGIAGDGSLRDVLEQQARSLGVGDLITWAGFCGDIPGFLSALDIYIQPSMNEGMSLSILEAMAAGKSVIATRVGSAEEMIADGENGLLIPPGNSDAIVKALKFLLENPIAGDRMALSGQARVKNEFDIQGMVDRYVGFYQTINAKRGKG